MGILEKMAVFPISLIFKDIEFEMSRTQKNKATEYHIGLLKGIVQHYLIPL
jgi:ribosome-interacting GTPase 1